MKKGSKLALFIGFVAAVAAVVAALSALLLYLDKKKDDEELDHYLDCSIQLSRSMKERRRVFLPLFL